MTDERAAVPSCMRDAILNKFPDLAGARFEVLGQGWDSTAIEADDRLVFKFPRSEGARLALIKEAALLAVARPALSMTVPNLRIHQGPPLFSSHEKIHGQHLIGADHATLSGASRDRLAAEIARFYVELHGLPIERMVAAGAAPIAPWRSPAAMRSAALTILPLEFRRAAAEIVAAYEDLPTDPLGTTYGFFDGHGWNMAFDYSEHRLNGIYDFADSGLGPRHQEFIYTNFISPDLTERVIAAYEELAGLSLDRRRIAILTGAHRLSEVADLAANPTHASDILHFATEWMSHWPSRG